MRLRKLRPCEESLFPNVPSCVSVSGGDGFTVARRSEGSNLTPAHHYPDFRFKTYAPLAFRYFRELFGIKPDDYLVSPDDLF